jgi:N6-adenosine-specific RNA methylase IME4
VRFLRTRPGRFAFIPATTRRHTGHPTSLTEVGRAWGFTYKTRAFEWLKVKVNGDGYAMGMGYWTRKQSESCLLFTRGSPRRQARDVREIIEQPRREHSRKPDESYRRIERLVGGPYAELFATERRSGWDGWGDQL